MINFARWECLMSHEYLKSSFCSACDKTDNWDRCYNKLVTKIYILLEYGLIPGLDEFEHNN